MNMEGRTRLCNHHRSVPPPLLPAPITDRSKDLLLRCIRGLHDVVSCPAVEPITAFSSRPDTPGKFSHGYWAGALEMPSIVGSVSKTVIP